MENNENNRVEAASTEVQSAADEATENAGKEAATSSDPQAGLQQQVTELTAKLKEAQDKVSDYWDQVMRARAELENMRRRMERDVERAHKYALDGFAQELLGVVDSLELGLAAAQEESASVEKLKEGKELTLKLLKNTLEKFNIKEVDPKGQPFNPEQHQAMTMQESSEQAPNTVLLVLQKGYLLNDRLIRPARVIVAKAPAAEG